jgi:hypothetical protein
MELDEFFVEDQFPEDPDAETNDEDSEDGSDGQSFLLDAAAVSADPLVTPTLAEMYLKQGFPAQALDVYRQLLQADPHNAHFVDRVAQLTTVVACGESSPETQFPPTQRVVGMDNEPSTPSSPLGMADVKDRVTGALEALLDKIERRRTCLSGKF